MRCFKAAFSAWIEANVGSSTGVTLMVGLISKSAGGGATDAKLTHVDRLESVAVEKAVNAGEVSLGGEPSDGGGRSPFSARFSSSSAKTRSSRDDMCTLRWLRDRWADSRFRMV